MTTSEQNEIIYCDGKYEVHPSNGAWAVVNSESGEVRCSFATADEATAEARRLNAVAVDRAGEE